MKVYLCGPINGCTDAEAKDWREIAKGAFPGAIDPMVRDYRGKEAVAYREIVDLDKRDVREADVILVQRKREGMVQLNVWCRREDVEKVRRYVARLNRTLLPTRNAHE